MQRICTFTPLLAQLCLLLLPAALPAQQHDPVSSNAAALIIPSEPSLPDANEAQTSSPQSDSASPANAAPKSQHEQAEEQIRQQEHQRVLGIVPAFNTSYRADAAPLASAQKMRLAFRSSIDPVTFAGALFIAGYHEAHDDYGPGFGWGAEGYGKRAGAAYLDSFSGNMIGNGILPSLLRQDPRYFRLGHGSFTHRVLYAAASAYICKGDRTRRWQPNVSNVAGNIAAGALSNLYYPSQDSGWGQTLVDGMIVTTEGSIGSIFQEFWPDISRKFLHRDPTHGQDAQPHP
ncbi:MAG TPA: hypothetical protein VN151_11170 [Terracidiphilus sp.]|nr:hypothetical protein [Terracidiphilus sp.]